MQRGGAAVHGDVHGDADVRAAAAKSDGGDSGTEDSWCLCQCGRAGWLIIKQPDIEGQPILALPHLKQGLIFRGVFFTTHSKTKGILRSV